MARSFEVRADARLRRMVSSSQALLRAVEEECERQLAAGEPGHVLGPAYGVRNLLSAAVGNLKEAARSASWWHVQRREVEAQRNAKPEAVDPRQSKLDL